MATIENFDEFAAAWRTPEAKRHTSHLLIAGGVTAAVVAPMVAEAVSAPAASASEIRVDHQGSNISVTIERNDTLSEITQDINQVARNAGSTKRFTEDQVAKDNGLKDKDLIIAGKKLTESLTPAPTAGATLVVQKGDTIYDIAGGNAALIKEYIRINGLKTSSDGRIAYIREGQKLIKPEGAASAPNDGHVVKKGEVLFNIAHGDPALIQRYIEVNDLKTKTVDGKQIVYLYENQVLVNPDSGLTVTPAPKAAPAQQLPAQTAETAAPANQEAPKTSEKLTSLPQETQDYINQNVLANVEKMKPVYQAAEKATGVPWQLLAAIHFRESGNDPKTSLWAGEPLGSVNPDAHQIMPSDPTENAISAANNLKDKAKNIYGVEFGSDMTDAQIGLALLAHNRGAMYKNASEHGYDMSWQDSPYVMAGMPGRVGMKFPDVGHYVDGPGAWGEPESTHGKVDKRVGGLSIVIALGYFDEAEPAPTPEPAAAAPAAELTDQQKLDFLKAAIRQNAVNAAKSQLGVNEASRIPMQRYSAGTDESWCADFASWINDQAGIPLESGPGVLADGRAPSTLTWLAMAKAGQSHMKFHPDEEVERGDYTAQPGDKVLMKYSTNNNLVNHIKTVVSSDGKTIDNIGGNEGDAVRQSNLSVDDPHIVGVIDILDH